MSRADVLFDADWAVVHLNDPKVVFIGVDEDGSAYDGGHIEGALCLDWKTELQHQLRRDFVNKEKFEELLSQKGVANDDTVVLQGGNENWFAAYAYWYFQAVRPQRRQAVDGGRKKWELDGRALTKDLPAHDRSSYMAQDHDLSIRPFRDEVMAAIGKKNLMDVCSGGTVGGSLVTMTPGVLAYVNHPALA